MTIKNLSLLIVLEVSKVTDSQSESRPALLPGSFLTNTATSVSVINVASLEFSGSAFSILEVLPRIIKVLFPLLYNIPNLGHQFFPLAEHSLSQALVSLPESTESLPEQGSQKSSSVTSSTKADVLLAL